MLYILKETGHRVLHVLAQNFGRPLTVQEIADRNKALYGKAHYANTYKELQRMKRAGLIRWDRKGRSAIIQLEPASPILPDYLVELEAWKKIRLAGERPDAAPKFFDIARALRSAAGLQSAWLLEAERSIRLNRFPILLLFDENAGAERAGLNPGFRWDAQFDELRMPVDALLERFARPQEDILRSWFASAVNLLGADRHWVGWLEAARRGNPVHLSPDLPRIAADSVAGSLAHYGYEEFGARSTNAPVMPLEALIVHVLHVGTPRQRRAVPVLLAKNPFEPALLAFMARRDGLALRKSLPRRSRNQRIKNLQRYVRD